MVNGVITLSDSESFKYQIIEKYISGKIYRNEADRLIKQSKRTISRLVKKQSVKKNTTSLFQQK
jgi:hypothetical protein